MTRFRFRLQALLRLREADRQERRVKLAEALAAERELAQRKAAIVRQLASGEHAIRQKVVVGQIDLARLLAAGDFECALRRELADIDGREPGVVGQVVERQQAVADSDREVRVLEKLRRRDLEEFRRVEALAETKVLDEAAARTTGHRSAG